MVPLGLFAVTLVCYVLTASTTMTNWDGYASSLAAWRLATTGEPWMEGIAFDRLTTSGDPTVWQNEVNGHLVTRRMFGPVLVAVPFYWLNSYGDEASFSIYRGGMAAATLVAASVLLLFLSLRSRVGDLRALVGATVFGFATPAWSVGANALWTHPMTMFGLAGAAFAGSRNRWWLAGCFVGFGMWARPHVGLVAAVVGLGVAWSRRSPRVAVAMAVPTSLSLVLLGAWNHYVFGSWHPLGAYAGKEVAAVVPDLDGNLNQFENVAGFLISPDRGLFVWTPVLIVLLPAVVRAWGKIPDWSRWLALGGVAYTALQLGLNYFGGSDAFYGYRHGLELLVCVTPACVFSINAAGRLATSVVPFVIALQFAMIMPGAVVEGFYVGATDVWQDNSFWLALRNYPEIFAPFTALCLLLGARVSHDLKRRASDVETAEQSAASKSSV
jgi:hypothetical protein